MEDANAHRPPMDLLGRRDECRRLDELVTAVHEGRSFALVLRGEAGIGKTTLMEHVRHESEGLTALGATGVESELELAFSGLHQLCAPMLDRLDRLPQAQGDALRTAFGLAPGSQPDRFLVGLGVLTLLADAACDGPVICLLDDVHWMDETSVRALSFVARRLLAEPIAMLFATRVEDGDLLSGLPTLSLQGLRRDDAHALLRSRRPLLVDERVCTRIVSEAQGNPLALLELPGPLETERSNDGRSPAHLAPSQGITAALEEQLARLSPPARTLLLAAAADPMGDSTQLWRVSELLNLGADTASELEDEGLVEVSTRVQFRHPVLRAVVYHGASDTERRIVHQAIADVTDPTTNPDGCAWHLAHAAMAPNEELAAQLARSAIRVEARGGLSAAAAYLEKAAELTPATGRRAARLLEAAEYAVKAGSTAYALELLTSGEQDRVDGAHANHVERLRARVIFEQGRPREASESLCRTAESLAAQGDPSAREAYLEALSATVFVGRLGPAGAAKRTASAARDSLDLSQPHGLIEVLLDSLATRITDGYVAALPKLRRALTALRTEADCDDEGVMRWLWLACPVAPEPIAPDLWDDDATHDLAERAVVLARQVGALGVLPLALSYRASVHVHSGELSAAAELLAEADRIAVATGSAKLNHTSLLLAAWRGQEAAATRLIQNSAERATTNSEGRALGLADHAAAVLQNGMGHYTLALQASRRACEYDDLGFYGPALAELVESGVYSGDRLVAAQALERLEERTSAASTSWALGIQERSRALLADGTNAENHFREAIDLLRSTRAALDLARAHLTYGEWLRRQNRRHEARTELRTAHAMFAGFGAQAFARRARDELSATGEVMPEGGRPAVPSLTTQESQIARMASTGLTNPQIAAELFLSPHTVEWHLRKVYAKLGIRSRRQLSSMVGVLPDGDVVSWTT